MNSRLDSSNSPSFSEFRLFAVASAMAVLLSLAGCQVQSTSDESQTKEGAAISELDTATNASSGAYGHADLLRMGRTRSHSAKYEAIGVIEYHHSNTF